MGKCVFLEALFHFSSTSPVHECYRVCNPGKKAECIIAFIFFSLEILGNFLVVQWLGLGVFTALAPGSIPGLGTKILQAVW